MKYAIVIPAIVACAFYVYVLVQLRRDDKRHSSHSSPSENSIAGPVELNSFTAVRKPRHSFPEWSRLSKRRNPAEEPKGKPANTPKQYRGAARAQRISYVELSLPLASGVAPVIEGNDTNRGDVLPKKIA